LDEIAGQHGPVNLLALPFLDVINVQVRRLEAWTWDWNLARETNLETKWSLFLDSQDLIIIGSLDFRRR